jgi:hypothetical protein
MNISITELNFSETQKSRINVKMDEIQLVQIQLNIMKDHFEHRTNPERKVCMRRPLSYNVCYKLVGHNLGLNVETTSCTIVLHQQNSSRYSSYDA